MSKIKKDAVVAITGNKKNNSTAIIISALEKKAGPIVKKLIAIARIDSQKDFDFAAELVKNLKELRKLADTEEKTITVPLEQAKKAAIAHFKPFKEKVAKAEEETKKLMQEFVLRQDRQIEKAAKDLESNKIKKVETYVNKTRSLEVHSAYASVRSTRKAVIVNEKLIPREYMEPNMKAINEAMKANKAIPGVEYKVEKGISI
jgi:hypothetical protein